LVGFEMLSTGGYRGTLISFGDAKEDRKDLGRKEKENGKSVAYELTKWALSSFKGGEQGGEGEVLSLPGR